MAFDPQLVELYTICRLRLLQTILHVFAYNIYIYDALNYTCCLPIDLAWTRERLPIPGPQSVKLERMKALSRSATTTPATGPTRSILCRFASELFQNLTDHLRTCLTQWQEYDQTNIMKLLSRSSRKPLLSGHSRRKALKNRTRVRPNTCHGLRWTQLPHSHSDLHWVKSLFRLLILFLRPWDETVVVLSVVVLASAPIQGLQRPRHKTFASGARERVASALARIEAEYIQKYANIKASYTIIYIYIHYICNVTYTYTILGMNKWMCIVVSPWWHVIWTVCHRGGGSEKLVWHSRPPVKIRQINLHLTLLLRQVTRKQLMILQWTGNCLEGSATKSSSQDIALLCRLPDIMDS